MFAYGKRSESAGKTNRPNKTRTIILEWRVQNIKFRCFWILSKGLTIIGNAYNSKRRSVEIRETPAKGVRSGNKSCRVTAVLRVRRVNDRVDRRIRNRMRYVWYTITARDDKTFDHNRVSENRLRQYVLNAIVTLIILLKHKGRLKGGIMYGIVFNDNLPPDRVVF